LAESPDDVRGQYLSRACDYEEELKTKNDGMYEIKNAEINTSYDDFGAVYYAKGMVFASERDKGSAIKREHTWTGNPFLELYFVDTKKNKEDFTKWKYGRAEKFSSELNTKYHDAAVSFSDDQKEIYFTRNNLSGKSDEGIRKLKIFYAKSVGDNEWSALTEVPFNSDEYSVAHPTLTPDGNKLYFSSDMPGGFGGMDLYVSTKEGGKFGPPQNLGNIVNTEGNEIFPYYHKSGKLYYSSDGHIGLGGLDLYYTMPKTEEEWTDPVNVGAPLNSISDDFGLVLNESGNNGHFSSDRAGGVGRDDIYSFKKTAIPIEIYVYDENTKLPISGAKVVSTCNKDTLTSGTDGKVFADLKLENCCSFTAMFEEYRNNQKEACTKGITNLDTLLKIEIPLSKSTEFVVDGIVFDQGTGLPLANANVVLSSSDCVVDSTIATVVSDSLGRFMFKLDDKCCYKIKGNKENYLSASIDSLCTKNVANAGPLKVTLELQPILTPSVAGTPAVVTTNINNGTTPKDGAELGKPTEGTKSNSTFDVSPTPTRIGEPLAYLLHIYYDFNQSYIRDEAKTELDKLLNMLNDNKDLIIEIASHTDARGTNKYNQRLSQRRADSVVRWLVDKGIERDRLVPVGYGESLPVNNCKNNIPCSEKEHQLNRRTEFRVLGCKGCVKEEQARISKPNENPKID
ncbi:MAG: OmpA family protein, partial [Saprospiraceae bacterium]